MFCSGLFCQFFVVWFVFFLFFFFHLFSPLEEKHNLSHNGVVFWTSYADKKPFVLRFQCLLPMCVDKQPSSNTAVISSVLSKGFCCHKGQNLKMLWTEENGWFSKAYLNLGIESKQFMENYIMTPLGMASSRYFHKQRNQTSFSKWIIECGLDKELYFSLTSYSSSWDSQNFMQSITLLHRDFSARLELLEKLEFCYETSV